MIDEQVTTSGLLSGIVYRTTRQGRHWVTATLRHDGGETEIPFYPDAYEVLRGWVCEGASARVTMAPCGRIESIRVLGHLWADTAQPDDLDEIAAFIEDVSASGTT